MEWKVLIKLLTVIFQTTVTVYGGVTEGEPKEEKASSGTNGKNSQGSIVMCGPEQSYYCKNLTHYSPCIHINLANLDSLSYTLSHGSEFYCGEDRCCQVGTESPCTYRCPLALNLGATWMYHHLKKKKKARTKALLTPEEVDERNEIVSIKKIIVRRKDQEEDYYEIDYNNNWKPSYRTFCPLRQISFKHNNPKTCISGSVEDDSEGELIIGNDELGENEVTKTTSKPVTSTKRHVQTHHIPVATRTTTKSTTTTPTTTTTTPTTTTPKTTTSTTTRRTTTKHTTIRPTTTKRSTTKPTTTRHTTTKHTTTKRTTTRSTTTRRTTKARRTATRHPTIKHTTTRRTTSRRTTTKRTTTRRTTTRRRTTTTRHTKPTTNRKRVIEINKHKKNHTGIIQCNSRILHRKRSIAGTCEDFLECKNRRVRIGRIMKMEYVWARQSCPPLNYFDSKYQICKLMETVNCDVSTNNIKNRNKNKSWGNLIHDPFPDINLN